MFTPLKGLIFITRSTKVQPKPIFFNAKLSLRDNGLRLVLRLRLRIARTTLPYCLIRIKPKYGCDYKRLSAIASQLGEKFGRMVQRRRKYKTEGRKITGQG